MKKNLIKKAAALLLTAAVTLSFQSYAFAHDDGYHSDYETEESWSENETEENLYGEENTTEEQAVETEDSVSGPDLASMNVGSFKSFMDYRSITSVSSAQYQLQQVAYTGDYGIRMVNGRYMVAVAATFGTVGDEIDVVLENGTVINCIIGDIKAYTDLLGGDGSLVEFIVDRPSIPDEVQLMGSFGVIFPGNVVDVR